MPTQPTLPLIEKTTTILTILIYRGLTLADSKLGINEWPYWWTVLKKDKIVNGDIVRITMLLSIKLTYYKENMEQNFTILNVIRVSQMKPG